MSDKVRYFLGVIEPPGVKRVGELEQEFEEVELAVDSGAGETAIRGRSVGVYKNGRRRGNEERS